MKVGDMEYFRDFLEVFFRGKKYYVGDGPFLAEHGPGFTAMLIPFDAEAVFVQSGWGVPLFEAGWNLSETNTSFGNLLAGGGILRYMLEHEPEYVSNVSYETCVFGSKYGNLWRYEP